MAKAQIPSKLDATRERLKRVELTMEKMLSTLSVLATSSRDGIATAQAIAAGILLFYSRIEKDDLEKQIHQLPPEAPPRRK